MSINIFEFKNKKKDEKSFDQDQNSAIQKTKSSFENTILELNSVLHPVSY